MEEQAMKSVILTAMLILGGGIHAAAADTFIFKDVQRPHGRNRSLAIKRADARKCGWTPDGRVLTSKHAMERCMFAHGWVVSQYIPAPPGAEEEDSIQFTDLSPSGKRGDAALQVDTRT